jgi:hypothetical protein
MSQFGDDVDPGEYLLRRVSKDPQRYDPSLAIPVSPLEFRPNRKRDADGLSFFRESKLSPTRLANSAMKPADNYVVVKIKVADLLGLGLTVKPDQQEGGTDRRNGVNFDQHGVSAANGCMGCDMVGACAHVARHAAKGAESNRTRNLAWQSLERASRPGVRAC